ncbi:MAG TPA: hypothetical protein VED85_04160 [Burkholderiaceae bacterium]|nr:hypothetical protein [Burkholderiaceae bacterium]
MTSHQILSLLQKRENLLKDLSEVNAQIIRFTLDHGEQRSMPIPTARAGVRPNGSGRRGGARRKWFERGEMIKIARKLLAQPMSQADLVRGLASAKGYDKGLPASERARFKSAAYQAIAAALNGKQLFRNRSGQVSTRR